MSSDNPLVIMPSRLTAENGAKAALIDEFHETFTYEYEDDDGELQEENVEVPVRWTTIKKIYEAAVKLLATPLSAAERIEPGKPVESMRSLVEIVDGAIKKPQPEPEPEWFDLTPFGEHRLRKDIDRYEKNRDDVWLPIRVYDGATIDALKNKWGHDQKFRCLLKDAPPELVAKASKPAEDPDEWVTQDRVLCRAGIDDTRWVRDIPGDEWVGNWKLFDGYSISYMHGDRKADDKYYRIEVRCRRRDLPPLPEQSPKPTTHTYHRYVTPFGQEFWVRATGETTEK